MITREHIEEILSPWIGRIENATLRDQVVSVWETACSMGGWDSIEDLKKMPFTLLTDTRGVNFLEHTLAVTGGAYELGKAQESSYASLPYRIDWDRLVAGGLLHDVGKLLEAEVDPEGGYRKSRAGKLARHPISGAILAAKADMPEEIINIIACHAKEGDGRPQVIETVLIHQADFATFNPLVMLASGKLIQE